MFCCEILNIEDGCDCDGVFWVKSRKCPSHYTGGGGGWKFDLTLGDKTGEIRLTYFDGAEDSIRAKFELIPKNSFVKVEGKVNIWHDSSSIVVGGYSGGLLVTAQEGEYDISQFIPESNRNPDSLLQDIKDAINELEDGPIKELLNLFMDDAVFLTNFKTHPAAMSIHHACKSGLLEHTWEVLSHCKTTVLVHGSLKKDLVYAGAILHDIGKIRELCVANGGFIPTEEGGLLGHVYLTVEMVKEKINQINGFPQNLKNHLFHILLSHHEKLEYGSPVETMTPEAITVACADAIGAKVSQYVRAVKDAQTDENKFRKWPIGWVYKWD